MSPVEIVIAVTTGLLAGVYAGLFGVGGGIVMVPAAVLLLELDQQVAQGTSLLVIVFTALAGTWASRRRELVDVPVGIVVGIAGAVGAIGGAALALRVLDASSLRRGFGVLLLLVAVRMIVRRRAPVEGG